MDSGSTIAAIATAPAPAGVGMVRVSGPDALDAVRPLIGGLPDPLEPRRAYLAPFRDRRGQVLDEGLWIFFAAPNSYTGEDVVELQAHGGVRLLRLLLEAVLEDDRVRAARPGEFTERAFLNGRIDLTRAEAIADLVAARSEAAVRSAAAQLRGGLFAAVAALREPLLALYADLEAALGFPDEADGAEADAQARLEALASKATALLGRGRGGRLVRRGARVVLFGPVNAGKSSLFNRLLEEERALVDATPGTTRDVLEAALELGGQAVTLVDTAGLREATDRIEAMGVARAREAVASADLAILVGPPECADDELRRWTELAGGVPCLTVWSKADLLGAPGAVARDAREDCVSEELGASSARTSGDPGARSAGDESSGKSASELADESGIDGVRARTSVGGLEAGEDAPRFRDQTATLLGYLEDRPGAVARIMVGHDGAVDPRSLSPLEAGASVLAGEAVPGGRVQAVSGFVSAESEVREAAEGTQLRGAKGLRVSAVTGEGVAELRARILEELFGSDGGEAALLTSDRHEDALRRAAEAIARAREALEVSTLEVVAGEVGAAVEALGEITGESAPRDLIDQIFARFCIGK